MQCRARLFNDLVSVVEWGGGGGFDLEWLRTKPSSVINNYWQKRFGDGGRRNGPSGLDKSLDELVTDKQSKTEYTQNADVV